MCYTQVIYFKESSDLVECQDMVACHGIGVHRYFPAIMKQQKSKDFANQVQGSMTVEQYNANFMELGRFAPHIIHTKEMHAKRFQYRLQPSIQMQVAYHQTQNFQTLVNVAFNCRAKHRSLAPLHQVKSKECIREKEVVLDHP